MEKLNLKVPETWEDVKVTITNLYKNNLEFGLTAAFNLYVTMLYQNDGQIYEENGIASALDSENAVRVFDEYTKVMPRRPLPEYMCIDEKHFEGDTDGSYAVVISDFFSGEVIDVLENRQMPYLDEYFNNIPFKERSNVKVFISDMYEGYLSIKNKFFLKATFVVDLFHVVKLLTTALNKIRIRTYNQIAIDDSLERHFMKTNWRYFLMDQFKICHKEYHSKKFDTYINCPLLKA